MAIYTRESLELLRQRVDAVDVISAHVDLKRGGATYKGLCPFHDEKSPSFMVQRSSNHYHCFGCGAHGDSIQFLMDSQHVSFTDAVELLAERYHVPLEKVEDGGASKGPDKKRLYHALDLANQVFHFQLLETEEGKEALKYLHDRGIDLDFVKDFQLGLASRESGRLRSFLHKQRVRDEEMHLVGLLAEGRSGRPRDFFYRRITIPIHDAIGRVIGFTARKYQEDTFGGKYVNTPETPLFKKSRVLFGLNYCRRRIAKERKVLIVEGQLDALRLVRHGFNITVAGQGTAFGQDHADDLIKLGVKQVFLGMDADTAGREAMVKVGNFFQDAGIEVRCLKMPLGEDPDSILRQYGSGVFSTLMDEAEDYLSFLFHHEAMKIGQDSPAARTQVVQSVGSRVRQWSDQIMVHESLKYLAKISGVPESVIGIEGAAPRRLMSKSASVNALEEVDGDQVLEMDCLRWLLLMGSSQPFLIEIALANLKEDDFSHADCRCLYAVYLKRFQEGESIGLLDVAASLELASTRELLTLLTVKKINRERAQANFVETIEKILKRNAWQACEDLRLQMLANTQSGDEDLALVQKFVSMQKQVPQVKIPANVGKEKVLD